MPCIVTLSNAFSQSSSTRSNCSPVASLLSAKRLMACSACGVPLSLLKPNCVFCRKGSNVSLRRFWMRAAYILYKVLRSEIGR